MIRINTNEWRAEIQPEYGGNLCRLQHISSGMDILHFPDTVEQLRAEPEVYGVPVLLPPNRIDGGKFRFQERDYVLPLNEPTRGNHLHGLIRGAPWRVGDVGPDFAVLGLEFTATSGFPHDFSLDMRYEFRPEAVMQRFRCTNRSKQPMPFGLGFHTTFRMPPGARAMVAAENYYWELTEPRFLLSGKQINWPEHQHELSDRLGIRLHAPTAEKIIDGKPFRGMIITYPGQKLRLHYELDNVYRFWFFWNGGGGRELLSAEPMTWMVNAPNLDLPPEITGLQVIEPGHTWEAETRFYMS